MALNRKAAKTGPGAMVLVAIEQRFPDGERILTDELACRILPFGFRTEVRLIGRFKDWIVRKSEERVPGLWGGIMARKRFIDDTIAEVAGGLVEAVVNLGAGFDTRAYRLPALAGVSVWEVDQPESIAAKRSRLERLFGSVPTHVTLVPIDFDHQDLDAVLASHGYRSDRKTLFIWEGVMQYLTEGGVRSSFAYLGDAPAGSRLVFTYTPRDFIDGEDLYGQEYLYERMLVRDNLWLFGLDPDNVDDFLGDFGWRVLEHLGCEELADRYVTPTGRKLRSMAIERIVYAEKLNLR